MGRVKPSSASKKEAAPGSPLLLDAANGRLDVFGHCLVLGQVQLDLEQGQECLRGCVKGRQDLVSVADHDGWTMPGVYKCHVVAELQVSALYEVQDLVAEGDVAVG